MRCPVCQNISHTRTSRYITSNTKEVYYQCQNIECSTTFKTVESVEKIISQPKLDLSMQRKTITTQSTAY